MPIPELVLEYIKTLLSALVWPAVVLTGLVLFRSQLSALIDRLSKARLPGGTQLDFRVE